MKYSSTQTDNGFHSKNVALLQSLLSIGTTTACYFIALYLGHVKLWPPPMISDCGVHPPEKFLFSIGLVCAAFLMFLFIWIVESAGKIYSSRKTAWLLGVPSSIGLMVLAVCNCEDYSVIHDIGTAIYFVCFALWCLAGSFKELNLTREKTTKWVRIRQVLCIVNVIFGLLMGFFLLKGYDSTTWQVATCEWIAVFAVEFYLGTFYWDLGDEYIVKQVKEY